MVSGKFEEQTSEVEGGGGEGERAWGGKVGDGESERPEARESSALGTLPRPGPSPPPPPAPGSCPWGSGQEQAGGTTGAWSRRPPRPRIFRVPQKEAVKRLNQVCVCVAASALGAHPAAGGRGTQKDEDTALTAPHPREAGSQGGARQFQVGVCRGQAGLLRARGRGAPRWTPSAAGGTPLLCGGRGALADRDVIDCATGKALCIWQQ